MKQVTFGVLILVLFVSLFRPFGLEVSQTSVAIALMLLLLVLFADLAEFDFWGLKGKARERQLEQLANQELIDVSIIKPPTPARLRKLESEDLPNQHPTTRENFLATTYEIERLLRYLARMVVKSALTEHDLTPKGTVTLLQARGVLTPAAIETIERLREVRELLITGQQQRVPSGLLDGAHQLALETLTQLKKWLTN